MKTPCFLLFISLLLIVPPAFGEEEKGREIVVRGDHDFAPFEFLDEKGAPTGFDIDILRAVAEVTGLKIEVSLGPWEEVRKDLEEGRIDALAGMRYSEERDLRLDFSFPYLINTSAIFVRKDSPIHSLTELRGKEILIQGGDIMEDEVRKMNLSANILFVDNQAEALSLLAMGEHDAALCSRLRGLYLVHKLNLDNLTVVGPQLAGGPYGFAVAEGDSVLLERLNEGLRILKATRGYSEIYQRWFGLYEKRSLLAELKRYALWILTPIFLLLAGAFVWSWTLRRQVARKTHEISEHLFERQKAEAQLATEKEFRHFVEASPVPMAIIDSGQNILYVNRKFTDLFGYTSEQLPDMETWWSLACPDLMQRQAVMEVWNSRFRATETLHPSEDVFEADITCREGALRHVLCRHSTIDNRHFIVFNDITKRKRAEKALESRSRVESMVSAISTRFVNLPSEEVDGEIEQALREIGEEMRVDRTYVFQFSSDGKRMSNTHEWCSAGIECHKWRLQDIPLGKFSWYMRELTEKGFFYCPSVADLGPEAREEKEEWLLEDIRSLITVAMLLKGEMVGFIGFDSVRTERSWPQEILFLLKIIGESFANALERRRVEEELRFAHQQMQDIIDFLPDATFVVDGERKVVAWNRAVEEMTGVPKEEMLGKGDLAYAVPFYGERRPTLVDMIMNPDVDRSGDYEVLQRDRQSILVEKHIPRIYDGKGGYVWAKASPFFDHEGNLVGAIESIRDISDRKKAQEELEAYSREMEAFVYTVSHDLRTPLTPIIGYADFLMEHYREQLDAQALSCLSEISASGGKMVALMEDLLALAKIGRLESPPEAVDTDAVVREILEDLAPRIAESGARVEASSLPALRVPDTLVYQIFSNLIGNAILYAGEEGSPIEIGGERKGNSVKLYVRDHGPGVAPEERKRIFDVFYRGQGGKKIEGTGIGLATVKKIARLYGGRARVEETPGGGATFQVEINDAGKA